MSWSRSLACILTSAVLLLASSTAKCQGQFGGGGGVPFSIPTREIVKPDSPVALAIEGAMDREVELGKVKVQVGRLGKELTPRLGGLSTHCANVSYVKTR